MIDWIDYLDIDNNYNGNDINKKCIKFVFLWIKYNHFYNERYTGDKYKIERMRAKALDLPEVVTRYEQLKKCFLERFKNLSCNASFRDYIVNLKNYKIIKFDENNFKLKNLLETIYQIRCNLFHGDKLENNSNSQIIAWAYDCLNELIRDVI